MRSHIRSAHFHVAANKTVKCKTRLRAALLALQLFLLVTVPYAVPAASAAIEGTPIADPSYNLLKNRHFHPDVTPAEWMLPDRGSIIWDSALNRHVLEISGTSPVYQFAQQDIALDPGMQTLTVSALVSFNNVEVTTEPWNAARIHVTFHNRHGEQLGGWPELTFWEGTRDWAWYNRTFDVPAGAHIVSVYAGLHHASGTVRFGDMIVNAFDASGKPMTRRDDSQTDTTNWLSFNPSPDHFAPTPIDMSRLLHKPAGKHGFLQISPTGAFVFADGTPARFLGVNIVANNAFPTHDEAERIARRLAKYGINLVRFHHLDAPWASPNIFSPDRDDTRHLSSEQLDRLDYFIYQLQQNGIYVFLDLLVHRGFRAADGVRDYEQIENGAKVVAHFDPHMIELQKEYAAQLLTHRNPYTGLRYIDDPGIVMVDIINESSLFWQGGIDGLPASYLADLDRLFNAWLLRRYGDRSGLAAAWANQLDPNEDPTLGTVHRASLYDASTSPRYQDTLRFYYELQVDYFQTMRAYLLDLGLQIPIAASNHWQRELIEILSNIDGMDFLDRHAYWDHPQGGWGWQVTFHNVPAVVRPESSIVAELSKARTAGLPFTVSEWQHAWPNEYIAEGPLLTTAYHMLQNADALLQFEFAGSGWGPIIEGNFDIGNKPHVLGLWPAVALMFHRGDVRPAEHTWQFAVTEEQVITGQTYDIVPSYLPLISRTELVFDIGAEFDGQGLPPNAIAPKGIGTPDLAPIANHIDSESSRYTSDTGELTWDGSRGLFTVDTPWTQGAVGFVGSLAEPVTLSDVILHLQTEFAVVIVSSLDDAMPISTSDHLLISTAARAENSGLLYNSTRTRILDPGTAPILVEPVLGDIIFPGRNAATVYALDENGYRTAEIPTLNTEDGLIIPLRGQAPLWYEIVLN